MLGKKKKSFICFQDKKWKESVPEIGRNLLKKEYEFQLKQAIIFKASIKRVEVATETLSG